MHRLTYNRLLALAMTAQESAGSVFRAATCASTILVF
jgi:hypothetical protein